MAVRPVVWNAWQSNVSVPADGLGTSVVAGGTAHTKNTTYTELIASTDFDAYAIEILGSDVGVAATVTSLLADIAIGGVGAETVIIPNLNFGSARNYQSTCGGQRYFFPLYIPAGSRVSATAQATIVSDTVGMVVKLWGRPSVPVWAGSTVTDYGTNLAASLGVTVVGAINSEGTYTEIVSATALDHRYIAVGLGGAADTTIDDSTCLIDVGVGAASEATILMNGLFCSTSSTEMVQMANTIGAYCDVPAGSRLTARISKGATGAQSYDVQLYGVS